MTPTTLPLCTFRLHSSPYSPWGRKKENLPLILYRLTLAVCSIQLLHHRFLSKRSEELPGVGSQLKWSDQYTGQAVQNTLRIITAMFSAYNEAGGLDRLIQVLQPGGDISCQCSQLSLHSEVVPFLLFTGSMALNENEFFFRKECMHCFLWWFVVAMIISVK